MSSTLIAAATDCSLSLSMETIDITTKDSAGFRELLGWRTIRIDERSGLIDYNDGAEQRRYRFVYCVEQPHGFNPEISKQLKLQVIQLFSAAVYY